MTKPPLDALVDTGHLKKEAPNKSEFEGMVASASNRLSDSRNTSLSIDGRFDLAYSAAHGLALAALRYHGYRPANRYIVFQSLEHTVGFAAAIWRVFDKCHKERNQVEYEGYSAPNAQLLDDLIKCSTTLETIIAKLPPL